MAANAAALALLVVGCGGSEGEGVSGTEKESLLAHLSEARAAVDEADRRAARQGLEAFAAEVESLSGEGALSESDAEALLESAARARARVAEEIAPPEPVEPLPPVTPEPEEPEKPEKPDKEDEKPEKPGKGEKPDSPGKSEDAEGHEDEDDD